MAALVVGLEVSGEAASSQWVLIILDSGRFVMVGNGGDAGNIYANNMAVPLDKYKLAVASTNTGHFGNSGDGTFAANNTESAIDFGYRAVHLTTVYSKEIIDMFYGKKASYSYWLGCSSGGKQGLKEIQMFPSVSHAG